MAQAVSKPERVTRAHYVAMEQASETKHEYVRGRVYAMSGASPKHITVLGGGAKTHPDFPHSLTNPSVLVEVLSPSTEAYDRGAKFGHYRRIESLQEYVLVSTDGRTVEHFLREANGKWTLSVAHGTEASIRFPSLDVTVPLAEIYAKLERVAPEGLLPDDESPRPPSVERK